MLQEDQLAQRDRAAGCVNFDQQ